ncbi:MAG: hypothetical protein LBK56_05955, partial [Gracilibacteraceae bacterium]|nr:hypothetical protein [Gracilibacteraceae bacterium]
YARAVTGSLNTTAEWQTVQIALPDAPLEKARVFIPHAEVKTQAAGLNITAESSYALLTFAPPLPENLSLEIRSAAPAAYISLIADGRYTLDAARETVFAGRTLFQSGVQEETITLSLTGAGGAIFTPGADSDFMITAFYVTPEGQEVSAPLLSAGDGTFVFSFRPETFGDYTVRFTAGWQDAEVISAEAPLAIQPVEPPMPAGPILLAALAAVAAVVIWRLTRRRSLEPGVTRQSIPLLAPEQPAAFTGRLDIYAVVTEGGKTELPGMSVSPRGPSEVTLSELFKQSGVTLHYEKADAIKVRPGNDAIVLRNGGGADILFMGRSIAKGQETVLRFGQKIYIVLNKDEDEFEIYYNRADEASGSGLRV